MSEEEMKKLLCVLLTSAIMSASALAFHHGPCKEGNDAYLIDWGDGTGTVVCCVEVGDGSELSCTDGDTWINLPN